MQVERGNIAIEWHIVICTRQQLTFLSMAWQRHHAATTLDSCLGLDHACAAGLPSYKGEAKAYACNRAALMNAMVPSVTHTIAAFDRKQRRCLKSYSVVARFMMVEDKFA